MVNAVSMTDASHRFEHALTGCLRAVAASALTLSLKCLHDSGVLPRIGEASRGEVESANRPRIKPLSLKVARHHSVSENALKGFDSRLVHQPSFSVLISRK